MKTILFLLLFVVINSSVIAQSNHQKTDGGVGQKTEITSSSTAHSQISYTAQEYQNKVITDFFERENIKNVYISYPDCPKYIDTGNEQKDKQIFFNNVIEWAKKRKEDFPVVYKELQNK